MRQLRDSGYTVNDMTDNEMAKLHVRYMVGGHARGIADELLYRFEFPERPGALLQFLQAIGSRWNISLFHYRNHGSDYGRVLAGIQVAAAQRPAFLQYLNELHYAYIEETANPAYRMFLGGDQLTQRVAAQTDSGRCAPRSRGLPPSASTRTR